MDFSFTEVTQLYVSERLYYNDSFSEFFYEEEGLLKPISDHKIFTMCIANDFTMYKQKAL